MAWEIGSVGCWSVCGSSRDGGWDSVLSSKVLGTYNLCHDFGNLPMAVTELKESGTQSRKQDKPQ